MQNNTEGFESSIFSIFFPSLPFFFRGREKIEASIWTIGIPDFTLWIFISNFFYFHRSRLLFNVIRGNIFDFGIWLNDDGSIWGIIYRFKIVWKFMIFFESFEWNFHFSPFFLYVLWTSNSRNFLIFKFLEFFPFFFFFSVIWLFLFRLEIFFFTKSDETLKLEYFIYFKFRFTITKIKILKKKKVKFYELILILRITFRQEESSRITS